MEFSDWQLNRLRDALRAYHRYERSHDGAYFTWNDVSEAIDEYTGVKVPPERLRQFVEGVNSKTGGRKFPVPQKKSIAGIVEFVRHEDINLLSDDELEEFAPHRQAPLRLLDYLDQEFDTARIVPSEKLEGAYQVRKTIEGELMVRELTLQLASDEGLIQVVETEEIYEEAAVAEFDEWSPQQRKEQRNSIIKHGGWAVLTPEDNLMFFMKKEHNGMNRYYFTMATDLNHWSEEPMTQIVLLFHDFPLEIKGSHKAAMVASDKFTKSILGFRRLTHD